MSINESDGIFCFSKQDLDSGEVEMRLIVLGAPGSGKGTIATELQNEYGIVHISTGDIFRANIKAQTPLGIEAKTYIDKGELVPDSVTIQMLKSRIGEKDCDTGFLLDGFPRTIPQAEALDVLLSEKDLCIDAVIRILVPDEKIMERVSGRRVCETCGASYNVSFRPTRHEGVCDTCGGSVIQREDDKPETVLTRLQTYREKTQPLIDFYERKNLILCADNQNDFREALDQIRDGLSRRKLI